MSAYNASMQYTIGTALGRAREGGQTVEVLVEGQWLGGVVVASDGVGIVLERDVEEHCVIRLDRIAAVRVCASSPYRRRVEGPLVNIDPQRGPDDAFPMPSPVRAAV